MNKKEHMEEKIRKLNFKAGAAMHDRILGDVLKAHDKSRNIKSAEIQSSVWRIIMKSKITKYAAAAVIIVGVLIGIKIYSGWGMRPGEDMTAHHQPVSPSTTVVKEKGTQAVREHDVQPTEPEADLLPANIKTMLAAGDFDGLAPMVAEGDSQTRLAVADFLAKMDDGVKALEVLDKLSAAHSGDEPDNPFAAAAERLRNRITDRQNVSNAGSTRPQEIVPLEDGEEPVASAVPEAAVAMGGYSVAREFEASPDIEERAQILFGTVVDERGSAVTDARVFASYALHGKTDANGGFALFISPTDGSDSVGPADFPMYVWAWRENDPYRVAWTLIRHLREETTQYPATEETHQGVKLVIEDGNDLAQYIPGDPGELFDEPEGGPIAEGIVLTMGPAGVIMGQVTDAAGRSVANVTVRIEEFTLGLGMNALTVNNLNHEWKADVSAVTDAHGYYQLSNLPISWTSVRLRAVLEGYGTGQAEYEGAGLSSVRGCDVQLTQAESEEDMPETDSEPLGLSSARGGFAVISTDADSSEDGGDEEGKSERKKILSGSLIDEHGNAVAGARVFGSFAHHGTTDANGSFALLISPEDSSNSLGSGDFPMYVWAYEENDPYRVAWTLIRHPASAEEQFERTRSFSSAFRSEQELQQPRQEATQYPITQETRQGVKLVVEDENDLAQYIPGNPGRLEDPNSSPTVHDIVLVMGPAGVIAGRVTDANGSAVAGATVSIDQLQMQLGTSSLTVSELDHDWKTEAFAVTDAQGYYQLSNLPASWTNIKLKAEADGYATAQQDFQNAGGNKLDGCDVQLVEAEQQESATTAVESGAGPMGMGMYGGYRRARE